MTKELKKAIEILENKGFCICNQFDGFFGTKSDEYELWKGEEIVEDHLTAEDIIEKANEAERSETQTDLKILKGVLLLRKVGNTYNRKEKQIQDMKEQIRKGYLTEIDLDEWIVWLKDQLAKTPEQLETEAEERIREMEEEESRQLMEQEQTDDPRNYSPSCPWNAPGMSVSDFI